MTLEAAVRSEVATEKESGPARQKTLDRMIRVLAMVGGSVAALGAGAQPTGSATADLVVLVLVGAAISAAVSNGPPAMWAAIAAIAALTTGTVGVAGQLTVAGGAVHGWRRSGPLPATAKSRTDFDSLVAALVGIGTTAALFRLQNVFVNRSSAALVAVIVVCVFAVTFAGLTRIQRRIVVSGILACSLAAIGISIAAAVSVIGLRAEVADASTSAREGVKQFRSGQTDEALTTLDRVQVELISIDDRLNQGWPRLAKGVPVVGQNIQALQAGSASAAQLVAAAHELGSSTSLDEIFQDGAIDLTQLEQLRGSLADLATILVQSEADLEAAQSPWLAPAVNNEVNELGSELEGFHNTIASAERFVEILPALLGADSPRNYLVLIANPSEARELGGFAGGYAVMAANDGNLSVVQSGRAPDLNHTPTTHDVLTGSYPRRFLEHKPWMYGQNYTAMADLGTLTQALVELFPSMGGQPIDGVLYLDPFALEALVALTGDVELPLHGITLTNTNTAEFFLIDQYERVPSQTDRTQVLDLLTASFFERLSDEITIDPARVSRLLRVVREGRLSFATTDSQELEVLTNLGIARSFGHDQIGDFLAVSHLNTGPNKLDVYLKRDIRYEIVIEPATGTLTAELVVTLRNEAPTGLSDYVAGNRRGLPIGTNRALLVVHTPHELKFRSKGPEPDLNRSFREFGLWRHEQLVIVGPGESRTTRFELQGELEPSETYELAVAHQPLVTTDDLTVVISANQTQSQPLAEFSRKIRANISFELDVE